VVFVVRAPVGVRLQWYRSRKRITVPHAADNPSATDSDGGWPTARPTTCSAWRCHRSRTGHTVPYGTLRYLYIYNWS